MNYYGQVPQTGRLLGVFANGEFSAKPVGSARSSTHQLLISREVKELQYSNILFISKTIEVSQFPISLLKEEAS